MWRTNTKRFLVMITDAPPHEPTYSACEGTSLATDPHGLNTQEQVAALKADKTTQFAITTPTSNPLVVACYALVMVRA